MDNRTVTRLQKVAAGILIAILVLSTILLAFGQ
jgi:hypothetical protein